MVLLMLTHSSFIEMLLGKPVLCLKKRFEWFVADTDLLSRWLLVFVFWHYYCPVTLFPLPAYFSATGGWGWNILFPSSTWWSYPNQLQSLVLLLSWFVVCSKSVAAVTVRCVQMGTRRLWRGDLRLCVVSWKPSLPTYGSDLLLPFPHLHPLWRLHRWSIFWGLLDKYSLAGWTQRMDSISC